VAPGAAHPTKQAPFQLFVDILTRLKQKLDGPFAAKLGLVFLGDEKDRPFTREILDHLNKSEQWQGPILNLAGRASLPEAALALREASALLSNDSSLGHIAEAVETPTAILFGPTIESFGFAPRMRQSKAFSVLLGCRPCSKHGKIECRFHDKLCFAGMPVPEIVQHLNLLLSAPEAKHNLRTTNSFDSQSPTVGPNGQGTTNAP
jgi:ADP-heptose:LPS heptosyltransferase